MNSMSYEQEVSRGLLGDHHKPEQQQHSRRSSWSCLTWLRCRGSSGNRRGAVVKKNGTYRVLVSGLGEHKSKLLADLFVTLVDLAWPYLVVSLFTIYLLVFMLFAVCWYLVARQNGDFQQPLNNSSEHQFCLTGVTSFPGAVMFSVETQTTLGYGFSYPSSHCASNVLLMFLQVTVGLLLETFMLGSIFVKIARPKHRAKTILFSDRAVICRDKGQLVLQVRLGDLRKSHLLDSRIAGMVIDRRVTTEGSVYPLYQFNCDFTADGMGDQVFLMFPVTLRHVIDQNSPLYDVSPTQTDTGRPFELVLYLSGTVESTGEMCQARTSYLPHEILWGYRFDRIHEFNTRKGQWCVNFNNFHKVVPCQSISSSARQLERTSQGPQEEQLQPRGS